MSDTAAFVLARAAEREALAREESARRARWMDELAERHRGGSTPALSVNEWDWGPGDPDRVLREVEATRRIVALCAPPLIDVSGLGHPPGTEFVSGAGPAWGEPALRLLASIDSDHPDYDPSWALS